MHAEPESETIPYSWYSSHFPLPQWSLTPDIDTGVQLKVYVTFRVLLVTSYVNDIKNYMKGSEPYWCNSKSSTGNCMICTENKNLHTL